MGGRSRRMLVSALVAILIASLATVVSAQPAVQYRFFGPSTPPGGYYPECANHFYQLTFYNNDSSALYGISESQARYSANGLTCAYSLTRPANYLYAYTRLSNYYTGFVCHTVADTNSTSVSAFSLARFWSTSCGVGVSVQLTARAGYKWNGSWYYTSFRTQCCEVQG